MRLICFAIFAAIALFAAVSMRAPAKPSALPLVQSSAKQPAFRLYSTCPVNRTNVPLLEPERKT